MGGADGLLTFISGHLFPIVYHTTPILLFVPEFEDCTVIIGKFYKKVNRLLNFKVRYEDTFYFSIMHDFIHFIFDRFFKLIETFRSFQILFC